jgi:hypothetical protein
MRGLDEIILCGRPMIGIVQTKNGPDISLQGEQVFPDINVHNDPYPIQFGSGDWITVITRATGTFTGEMILPDGKVVAPTGKSFDLDFATTAKWEGDLLLEEFVFVDPTLRAKQIGLA